LKQLAAIICFGLEDLNSWLMILFLLGNLQNHVQKRTPRLSVRKIPSKTVS